MQEKFGETAKNLEIQIAKIQEADEKLNLVHQDLDKNLKLEETRLESVIGPFIQEKAAIKARLHSKMATLLQGCNSFTKDYETCLRSEPSNAISMLRKQVQQEENLVTLRQKEIKLEHEENLLIEQAERLSTYVHENRNILRLLENITREIESKLYELERSNEQKKLWQSLTALMKEQNKLICEQEDLKLEIADTEQRIQKIIEQHKSERQPYAVDTELMTEGKRIPSDAYESKYMGAWISDLPTAFKGFPPKTSTSKSRLIKKYIENPKEDGEKTMIGEEKQSFNRMAPDDRGVVTKSNIFLPEAKEETTVNFEFLGKLGGTSSNVY